MSDFLRGVELQKGVLRLARRGPRPVIEVNESEFARPAPRTLDLQAQLEQAMTRLEEDKRNWREQAERELATIREQVAQEARAAGHAQALADARDAYRQKQQELDDLLTRLGGLLGQDLESAQDLVVAIAYEAVAKIVGDAVATPEGVRAVVVQAISAARQQEKLVVRVPQGDYRLLIDDLPGDHPLARPGIEIRPDAQLADGGCVIETDAGQLDARLGTQFSALHSVLLQARRQADAGRA